MIRWSHEKFSDLASTAASQHGVLTFEQLQGGGLTDSQIRYRVHTGQLIRQPGQVFLVAGSVPSWRQRVAAASLGVARHVRGDHGGPIGAASHHSAARLFGMRSFDDEVDVTIRYPRRATIRGVRVVRSRDLEIGDITWVDNIPVTTPERTIVDLGLDFPQHEVMRILRHAVATGLVTRTEVVRMRKRTSKQGRDGTGIAELCLQDLPEFAELTESGSEVLFLEVVERQDLPRPVVQLPVMANGRSYRLDFAYPQAKVFVEIDGSPHDDPVRIAMDGGRQNNLVASGWQPIRLHYDRLKHSPGESAETLRTALARHL